MRDVSYIVRENKYREFEDVHKRLQIRYFNGYKVSVILQFLQRDFFLQIEVNWCRRIWF